MDKRITDEAVEAAKAAYNASMMTPRTVKCTRCEGKGYHHGFGEDGADPDWCETCGGGGYEFPDDEDDKAIRAALAAALPYLSIEGASGVEIKALEWEKSSTGEWRADHYRIRCDIADEPPLWIVSGWSSGTNPYDTLEAAKAAAQADYERRILSALSAPRQPGEATPVDGGA